MENNLPSSKVFALICKGPLPYKEMFTECMCERWTPQVTIILGIKELAMQMGTWVLKHKAECEPPAPLPFKTIQSLHIVLCHTGMFNLWILQHHAGRCYLQSSFWWTACSQNTNKKTQNQLHILNMFRILCWAVFMTTLSTNSSGSQARCNCMGIRAAFLSCSSFVMMQDLGSSSWLLSVFGEV